MFFDRQRNSKWDAHKEIAESHELWWEIHAAGRAFELAVGYTRTDVQHAFRRLARRAHPDIGGTREAFQTLIAQRDLLLGAASDRRLHVSGSSESSTNETQLFDWIGAGQARDLFVGHERRPRRTK